MLPASSFLPASLQLLLHSIPAKEGQRAHLAQQTTTAVTSSDAPQPRDMASVSERVRLITAAGDQFGISLDEFPSRRAFAVAISQIAEGISQQDDGLAILAEIETAIGLADHDLTLPDLIEAFLAPGGEADAVLAAKLSEDAIETEGALPGRDDGTYGFWA